MSRADATKYRRLEFYGPLAIRADATKYRRLKFVFFPPRLWEWRWRVYSLDPIPAGKCSDGWPFWNLRGGWLIFYGPLAIRYSDW